MKRRNYESDFIAQMKLPMGLENIDFELIFSTNGLAKYLASRHGDVLKNCAVDVDGRLSVVFKNHGLQPGMLKMKFISFVPNPDIPGDNIQKIVTPRIEDVELVTSAGDECSDITFDIAVDYAVIDAYDMAIKAGYKGSREEYIKMLSSKPKSSASNILHRKCIRYNSPTDEIYSGPYLIIPNPQVGERYNVVGLYDYSSDNYDIVNGILTVKVVTVPFLVDLQLKSMSPKALVKFNAKRELVINEFHHASPVLNKQILFDEIRLSKNTIDSNSHHVPINVVSNQSVSIEVDIWKPMRRTKMTNVGRVNIKNLQWVKVRNSGTAYSDFNKRTAGPVFLIRARRCNARRTAHGEWHYFHVKYFYVHRASRWVAKEIEIAATKASVKEIKNELGYISSRLPYFVNKNDGVLHLLAAKSVPPYNLTYITLNGKRIDLEEGEHFIECRKGSVLSQANNLIGIYRFDGTITCRFNHGSNIVFINNTTVEIRGNVWFDVATRLQNLDGVVCKCVGVGDVRIEQSFASTALINAPYLWNTKACNNLARMYSGSRYLESIPLYDTSNVTNWGDFISNCDSIKYLPGFDTTKATDIRRMFYGCRSLKSIQEFKFANVITAEMAFATRDDVYGGNLLRFPYIDFDECDNLNQAWEYQNRMVELGKIKIPKCTILTNAFRGCDNLTTVRGFTGLKCDINLSYSPKLTLESMINIMNEAANVTALGVRNMVFGATNLAKLSDAQKAIATAKGWSLS